jgi:hypothetical protein
MAASGALGAIMVAATVAGLVLSRRPGPGATGSASWWRHPAASLGLVTGLIYVNQVLFTVYLLRLHGGDPTFIARYVPPGWFAVADSSALDSLAQHFPFPGLLAPSVLRIQAFLELPFVVFAYLTVCGWFSTAVYRAALRLVPAVSASYTATFCLIEWSLHNPYTVDDILIRVAAAVVVPFWAARLSRDLSEQGMGLPGLLAFAASTAGLGMLVLVVYDTALLYNLGHLDEQLPMAGAGLALLVASRMAARFLPAGRPGQGIESTARSFGWFLVAFFVAALPIRYGLGFGTAPLSALAGLAIVTVAIRRGVKDAFAELPGPFTAWAAQMAVAALAGSAGAAAGTLLPVRHAEGHVLSSAAGFLACAMAAAALIDRVRRRSASQSWAGGRS